MEDLQNLINELDLNIQAIEQLEKENQFVKDYITAKNIAEKLQEQIKTAIKEWEDIKETQTLIFKKSERYAYSPEKLRAKFGAKAEHFITTKESVDAKLIAKWVKDEILTEDVSECRELQSISITTKLKSEELTNVEI